MGAGDYVRTTAADFKRGFRDATESDDDPALAMNSWSDYALATLVGVARVTVYGFLLVLPGVPFLPWGKPWPLALTLIMGFVGSVHLGPNSTRQVIRCGVVAFLAGITLGLGPGSNTSMVLAGAFVSAVAGIASNYSFAYGVMVGMASAVGISALFHLHLLHPDRLPLSGRLYTPDRAAYEAFRLAGFLFLTFIIQIGRHQAEAFRVRATEAEAARAAAVSDERARMARELHDVVSHHVTGMTLQAEAAALTGDRAALRSVATAGREALGELRRMLGVLRRPSDASDEPSVEPQPGVADLEGLASRASSGPAVTITKQGDVRPLAAGLELCVFRLVQEALTNAAKHGDATEVGIVLSYGIDSLTVTVRDNGRPLTAPKVRSGGMGLIGMQERVALLDGELFTGPRSDGTGYEVVAHLPVGA